MLDGRKLEVLYAIINSYVDSAEPIGSRTISKNYNLGVSSATIRNEMSDLEELGYLTKPHSSAGRVPSDKAYRLYVNELLKLKEQHRKENEKNRINNELINFLINESSELDELIENSAKLLSSMTNYTSVVATPKMQDMKVEKIQLVAIENVGILILLIFDNGVVKSGIYKTNKEISNYQLNIISNLLNEKYSNLKVDELSDRINDEINNSMFYEFKDIVKNINPIIKETLKEISSVDLYSEGITNILDFPEYRDIDKAKELISFIENKDLFLDVLYKSSKSEDIDIVIGKENIHSPIKDISMITATYTIKGSPIGKIGLIGPTRMDYLNLMKTVKSFSDNLTQVINILINS